MKKPAVVSFVVLALLSLSATPSFADTPPGAAAKPARKARKPAATPSKAATAAPPPAAPPPAAPPPAAPPPAAAPAPAPAPAAQTTTTSASLPDEPKTAATTYPSDEKPIALAPLVGYASEDLKLGFGARASYTFPNQISVAGTFVYHLGTSREGTSYSGVSSSASIHAFYPGVEGGYDLHVDRVVIRPYLGMAALFVSGTVKVGNQESSDTKSYFALYPGVMATYDIPESAFFAGADARLLVVTDGGDPSFGFFGTFGMRL